MRKWQEKNKVKRAEIIANNKIGKYICRGCMNKRVFIFVLDSLGIGELPDAYKWNDEGSNTLKAIRYEKEFDCPMLKNLGLFNIETIAGGVENPMGSFARMAEQSLGKDTTVGHWEIAGLVSDAPLPTYPNGFPKDVIEKFEKETGVKTLCNKPYSGTEVIKDYGNEHLKTGALIVYTSADSVFQIATHVDKVPLDKLYSYCEIARKILVGKHGVGRVIARPFTGSYPFVRTADRHDYSLEPPRKTMLDLIKEQGYSVIAVGKIKDIFAGRGITESIPTKGNSHGQLVALEICKRDFSGLCFVNLVDFDMKYGHRNDIKGYANAMTEFDLFLTDFLPLLNENDMVIITGDHGCDPSTVSTDHSREYVPMIVAGKNIKSGVDLKTRSSFADISATVLEYLNVEQNGTSGISFLKEILKSEK